MMQSLSRQIMDYWIALPWHLKIASILMVVLAAIVFVAELIGRFASAVKPSARRDPYLAETRRKQRDMEHQRAELRRKIQEYDQQYQIAKERFKRAQEDLKDVNKEIDGCSDISCIDDVLRRKYGPGDDSGA